MNRWFLMPKHDRLNYSIKTIFVHSNCIYQGTIVQSLFQSPLKISKLRVCFSNHLAQFEHIWIISIWRRIRFNGSFNKKYKKKEINLRVKRNCEWRTKEKKRLIFVYQSEKKTETYLLLLFAEWKMLLTLSANEKYANYFVYGLFCLSRTCNHPSRRWIWVISILDWCVLVILFIGRGYSFTGCRCMCVCVCISEEWAWDAAR